MKKTTLILWAIIIGFIALVIFQNQTFFLAKQSLRINFGIAEAYHAPELPVGLLFLIFFFAGVAIAYLFNFPARMRARRTIKKLNASIASHASEVTDLKGEIQSLKGEEVPIGVQTMETGVETIKYKPEMADDSTETDDEKAEKLAFEKQSENPAENSEEQSGEKPLSQ